jgi:hypothetical protein
VLNAKNKGERQRSAAHYVQSVEHGSAIGLQPVPYIQTPAGPVPKTPDVMYGACSQSSVPTCRGKDGQSMWAPTLEELRQSNQERDAALLDTKRQRELNEELQAENERLRSRPRLEVPQVLENFEMPSIGDVDFATYVKGMPPLRQVQVGLQMGLDFTVEQTAGQKEQWGSVISELFLKDRPNWHSGKGGIESILINDRNPHLFCST